MTEVRKGSGVRPIGVDPRWTETISWGPTTGYGPGSLYSVLDLGLRSRSTSGMETHPRDSLPEEEGGQEVGLSRVQVP